MKEQTLTVYFSCARRSALLRVTHTVGKKPFRVVRCWKRETLTPLMLTATVMVILRELGLPMNDRPTRLDLHALRAGEMLQLTEVGDAALYSATVVL